MLRWFLVILAGFCTLLFVLVFQNLVGQDLQIGQITKEDIVANQTIRIVDERATELALEQTQKAAVPVIKHDQVQEQKILDTLRKNLRLVPLLQADFKKNHSIYKLDVSNLNPISNDVVFLAVSINSKAWTKYAQAIDDATKRLLAANTLLPWVPKRDWERTVYEFLPDVWSENIRQHSASLIVDCLEPTASIDLGATGVKQGSVKAHFKPILKIIKAGQIIVPKDKVITSDDLAIITLVNAAKIHNWPRVIALGCSLLAAFFMLGIFFYLYERKHLYSPTSLGMMCTLSVVVCAVAAFAGQEYLQFVPLPAVSLILTIFFGPRLAISIVIVLIVLLAVGKLVDIRQLVGLGIAAGVAVGINVRLRKDLMMGSFFVGLAQAGGFLMASLLLQAGYSALADGKEIALQIMGGLSSCIVAIGSLPFLENLFGMVTSFKLAELVDPTQPLLRQLEESAPGTYQHSLAVANLAEAGAKSIGANVNLVRAGSLYHDIGKMMRPRYFIENQLGDRNPHDKITPEESRDRVLAHVTEGLAMASKYGLPKLVQDFIPQHQGTTLMAYFYHKACLRDGTANVDATFYRYPGPKPQTKEAAIVMLADVSEAVTHSLKEPSQEEVESSMAAVFKARWDDGQFVQTGLTEDELSRVKNAFVRVWRTLHHERLKYPATTTGRMPFIPTNSSTGESNSQLK